MDQLNQVLLRKEIRAGADLDVWLAHGGGEGLKTALQNPAAIIPLIQEAGLRGLGGSGFPTYKKWEFVAANAGAEKYLICNGNEDEPGTFKDCILLSETPHQVIEGAVITALATGINRIVFYINPDQQSSLASMRKAVEQWQASDLHRAVTAAIGEEMGFRVMESSGHYIGGEETAAIESVEGKFPFPRGKPPYPSEYGVHGCPTLINNMETMANVSHLLRNGVEWFRALGYGEATGTKIYCLTGDVLYPGAYELPMGTQLSTLINEYGGGMLLDKNLKAVFTGGPSNTILTPKDLDVPLDYESVSQRHSSL
ncbi:MAG: SLBB domain-containing protein, partial [Gammaproteobacteria bacterium]